MGQQIEELARFAADTAWNDIPKDIRQYAKLVVLDTLGVMLAGAEQPDVRNLRERLAPTAGTGATMLARGWPAADPRTAALVNGIAGRSIELCEGLRLVSGQPAIQILPGALAVGEHANSTGRELLTAFVVAYELAGRLCTAFTARPLAHQNGQAIMLAAAACGARLRKLDAKGVSLAMRIVTTMIVTPSYNNAVAGATALNVAGGMSSFACALAPDLAQAGFEAQPDAIEEALGQLVGGGFKTDALLDELGTRWELSRNYFRLYASCNPMHPALDALAVVLGKLKPKADDIERIDIATYRFASVMRNPDPPNYFGSKYSMPHVAATMVVRGRANHAAVNDDAVNDPAIVALRHRVTVTEDAAMSAVAPKQRPARVTVKLRDGRSEMHEVRSHRGDFDQPFAESEVREKFRELAATALTPAGVAAVEKAVDAAEKLSSVRELVELMRRHGLS